MILDLKSYKELTNQKNCNTNNHNTEIKQVKPQFTEAQFENAKNANATIEQIKSKYSITSEMETKFNNYVTA
jgi:hypothetical protein